MGIQIYLQRKRKVLAPVAAAVIVTVLGLLAFALPKAEAHGLAPEHSLTEPMRLLLVPQRVASLRFLDAYDLVHR